MCRIDTTFFDWLPFKLDLSRANLMSFGQPYTREAPNFSLGFFKALVGDAYLLSRPRFEYETFIQDTCMSPLYLL